MCVCLCVWGNSALHFAGSSPLWSAVASRLLLCPWATWARHQITPQPLGYFDCFVAVLRSDVPAERCEERWGRQLRLGVSITCFSFFLLFYSVLFASFSFLLSFSSTSPFVSLLLLLLLFLAFILQLQCLGYFLASPWKKSSQPACLPRRNKPKAQLYHPQPWRGGVYTFLPQNWVYNTLQPATMCVRGLSVLPK